MTFDHQNLVYFVAIADKGSLGQASHALGITQPALSRAMKRMEEQIGVTLFERVSRGMILTSYGAALLPYARRLIADSENALAEIDSLRGLDRGTVRVGAIASAAVSLVPAATRSLLAQRPKLSISITEDVADRLVSALLAYELDIVIAAELEETADVMRMGEAVGGDVRVVFGQRDHPAIVAPTLESLSSQAWVMPPQDALPRRQFDAIFDKIGRRPRVAVETRSLLAMRAAVIETELLGWLPRQLLSAERALNQISDCVLPEMAAMRSFALYRRRSGFMSPAAMHMARELRAVAASVKAAFL